MPIPDPGSVLHKQVGEPIWEGPACIASLAGRQIIWLLHMQGGKSDWTHVIHELTPLLVLQNETLYGGEWSCVLTPIVSALALSWSWLRRSGGQAAPSLGSRTRGSPSSGSLEAP